MVEDPPSVYLLHGEDEFRLSSKVAEIEARLGDAALADLNIDRIDGRAVNLEELRLVVGSMPMFVSRRLVIVDSLINKIGTPLAQEKFLGWLGSLPATTALVLVEHHTFKADHWLLSWARKAENRVYLRSYEKMKREDLIKWVEAQAISLGGKITPRAADLLVSFVGEETRLAYNELNKLLAYAGYQRPIEYEDVDRLVPPISQAVIFDLVDAVGNKNSKLALSVLRKLCATSDLLSIFSMIVRQVRLVLQAKEILSKGQTERDVARVLQLHPFVSGKVSQQAKNFTQQSLEHLYHRLMGIDLAVKTGRAEWETALESLVADFK